MSKDVKLLVKKMFLFICQFSTIYLMINLLVTAILGRLIVVICCYMHLTVQYRVKRLIFLKQNAKSTAFS